jgi:hypothetical protein
MTNRYGVDVAYFKKELAALSKSLPDRTPDELARYFIVLHNIALPIPKSKESRPTVRAKRPVQHAKLDMPPITIRARTTVSTGMAARSSVCGSVG